MEEKMWSRKKGSGKGNGGQRFGMTLLRIY